MALLVVYIHMYSIDAINFSDGAVVNAIPIPLSYLKYLVSQIIARSSLPIFFLISGFLLYKKPFSWKKNIRTKTITLLIPYLFWNAAWLLFFFVAQNIELTAPYFINKVLQNYTVKEWINAFIPFIDFPFLYPLWFLFNLYLLNLLAPVIKWLIDKLPVMTLFAFAVLWINEVEILTLRPMALFFFSFGYYVVKYNLRIEAIDSIKWTDIGLCYLLGIAIELLALEPPFKYTFNIFNMFNVAIGAVVFVKLTGLIITNESATRIALRMSAYSFFIYVFHEYTLTIVNKLFMRFIPQTSVILFAEYFLIPIAVTCFCIVVAIVLKRMMPSFYNLITGARR